ncbi:virulence RhuM family protein [Xanthomonas sp. LF06-19]|uniref:virulence RhuM family protein n=1 Tax=Xanthomonas sp. LF06-19 TaxID=3097551 RepID=UPI002A80ABEC|nr:virulence RhuM family protein [Xanthomonas sp. LF06-19]MDY4285354.1 virulence RhuM family protein [Xanthomonas sp. LF06-19]
MRSDDKDAPTSELILYRSEDAQTRIQVRLEGESVWLTQAQIAELYQTTPQNVTQHLRTIYEEGELREEATCKDYLQVRQEGTREVRRNLRHYNLDAILAVGYRVRSARGTQFRQWATARLSEYLVKGFALDDERLKRGPDDGYFEELLGRIRDIRSSEKLFWRKVLDIYATSVDYDPSAEASQRFFATVQNKMHWAAHGHTAAELLMERADASKPHSGMTNWVGAAPRASDAVVAKSYLNAEELEALNRIVTAYLEFAELQAMNRRPMTMDAWIAKLDDFLRLSDREVLTHAGRIGREQALEFSKVEFARYRQRTLEEPSPVERDFEEATRKLKALESDKRRSTRTKGPTGE